MVQTFFAVSGSLVDKYANLNVAVYCGEILFAALVFKGTCALPELMRMQLSFFLQVAHKMKKFVTTTGYHII
jgi:hypothetical protein